MTSPGERRPDDGGYRPEPTPHDQAGSAGRTPYDPPAGGSADPPYVYNPYGNVSYPSSYPVTPAGLGPDTSAVPARRPGALHLALALVLVSAAPFVLLGTLMVLGAAEVAAAAPPAQLEQLRSLGVEPAQVVRNSGLVLAGGALVFALFGALAWTGRRWARALLAAMTLGFALLVLALVVGVSGQGAALDPGSLLVICAPLALAVVAVVLMFRPAARAWFRRR